MVARVLDLAIPRLSVHAPPIRQTSHLPTVPVSYDYPFPVLRHIHCVNTPSGRLVHFLDNWKTITQDNWVLQTVVGYKIPFTFPPRQWRPRITTTRSIIQQKRMDTAIQTLASQEGSNQGGSTSRESIHFLPISSGESLVQGRISTNYQPETLEQICRRMVLQNGGSSSSLFFDTTERFHDETRSQGRILFSPSSSRLPQIPTLCVQREDIRVPMSPIRVEISPSSLHQANDSSHIPYPEFGNTNCHLPGRRSHLTSGSQCSTIYL